MNIRRVALDVDWAAGGPEIEAVAAAISDVAGVKASCVTITEIDMETIGSDVIVEGTEIDLPALKSAIEGVGAVVHSVDQLAEGDHVVEFAPRER